MFKSLFDAGYKEYKRCEKIAKKVFLLEEATAKLTDEELKAKTFEFKERYQKGETLDDLLVEAYAVVREASRRVTGMFPFFVQVAGAIAIHGGNIAEMKTGEGKTLTGVMPAYLNALSGDGVHIVTVNEYLAARETEGPIGEIYRFLGLTVGLNVHDMSQEQKKEAYQCDILYSTNAELGFDYLRDHMVLFKKDMVQRPLNYAIIDEVDSILIDEARTPLIISGGQKNTGNLYILADRFAKSLEDDEFLVDIETKTVNLTQKGIAKAEKSFKIDNLYDLQYVSLVHHINNALKANYTMDKDKEYMVVDGEVLIIDSFTGRVLKGRQYSDGLHQAIEAKENVEIKKETITLATITYQNFFRMYKKLSGMTGTAKTEEEEFIEIYNMYVVEVPTNLPVIREDMTDLIYLTVEAKYKAIIEDVKERHKAGQPILIGTIAVETSEIISKELTKAGIKHNVLNAKFHEQEAEIIAAAGQKYAVTIATNMAGRGTDIKLGEGVKELGGLAVIGTERHESRRIDNQLRGRSGRQGDPGYSRFYLSADDELLLRFGGDSFKNKIKMIIDLQKGDENSALESKMFAKFVSGAQKRIEGSNYDSRKTVLKYDDIIRKQREIIYGQRTSVLVEPSIEKSVNEMIESAIRETIDKHITYGANQTTIEDEDIVKSLNGGIFKPDTFALETIESLTPEEIHKYVLDEAKAEIARKKEIIDEAAYNEFLKVVVLRVVDTYWTKHIDQMAALRQGVTLQAYGQGNPFQLYQERGFEMFEELNRNIAYDVTKYVIRAEIRNNLEREEVNKPVGTNAVKDESRKRSPSAVKTVVPKIKPVEEREIGKNEFCPCGSGKKYKNCCMGKK